MKTPVLAALLSIMVVTSGTVLADEGKDESGKGKEATHRPEASRGGDSYFHKHGYTRLDIPKGHYPPPGECRVWYPGRPAGQQPPPIECGDAVPGGAWLIRHPPQMPNRVHITVYDPERPRGVRAVGEFDIGSGVLVRVVLDK